MLEPNGGGARSRRLTPRDGLLPLLILLTLPAAAGGAPAHAPRTTPQQTQTPRETAPQTDALTPGRPVVRELPAGQKHSYAVELTEGQLVNVEFEGRGLNAAVRIFDPAGELVNAYDVSPSATGRQTIEVVAEARGIYRLDISARPSRSPAPGYTVQVTAPRLASARETELARARRMYLQANALTAAGKQAEALTLARQSVALREQHVGAEHISVANSRHQLGNIFYAMGDYPQAETQYLRALAIREKLYGADSGNVAVLVNNLGGLYGEMGDYDRAEQFMRRAVGIQEKQNITNDPTLAITLHNLGNVQELRGDYNSAEQTYERAHALKEKIYGAGRPETALTLLALAGVAQEKGDYVRSENLSLRSLSVFEATVGEDDTNTVKALLTLASVYRLTGDPARAAPLYERALKIFEKTLEADHPLVALALNNLGDGAHAAGDFARAEKLYLRALEIRERKLGAAHPDLGMTLENLGLLRRDRGDYEGAEQFYRRALQVEEKALGAEHPFVVSTLTNMSLLYAASGDFAAATSYAARAVAAGARDADLNLRAGSERQKLAYLDLISKQLNQAVTLNVRLAPGQPEARDLAVTAVLRHKGRVQDALADSFASLRGRLDARDAALLDQFNDASAQLARLVFSDERQSEDDHSARVAALRERREQIEAEISRRSAEFRSESQVVTLAAVRAALPDDAALLEFIVYRPPVSGGAARAAREGAARYAVYVIRSQGDVRWVDLGTAHELDGAVTAWRQALAEPGRQDVRRLARAFDEKVMRPVRALAGDAKHLLVSPDGELNLMPFAALIDERGRFLIERYAFTYLTSGRDLLRMQAARPSRSSPLIVAAPSFGENAGQLAATNSGGRRGAPGARRRSVTDARSLSEVYFAPLGGATQEARDIQSLLTDASLLTGGQATESALKQVVAPRVLHIATHGFFLQDVEKAPGARPAARGGAGDQVENSLLRSGLALAGANSRQGGGGDDGILTALEASGLNLWGTKLVVLSACDTGLGEVRNGEGVYGLRRAFVLAGTESLLMSLWPASDYSTRRLMTDYYRNLRQGVGRGAALRQVQLELLKRNPRLHPFYWANFIQSGEWADLDGRR